MNALEADSTQRPNAQKILIVEDEHLVAMYLSDLLDDLGHEVLGMARSRVEAIEVATMEPPALALVDIGLSGGDDGIAVANELADRFGTAIIILTGAGRSAAEDRMANTEPVAVLSKPCDHKELADAISRGLATRKR